MNRLNDALIRVHDRALAVVLGLLMLVYGVRGPLLLVAGTKVAATVTLLYTLTIACLMVSQLPVLSGKRVGKRVPPEMVLPVIVLVILFFALLIAYPWWVLAVGTVCYLACLPLGWFSYREYRRKDAASAAPAPADMPAADSQPVPPAAADPERPVRLN